MDPKTKQKLRRWLRNTLLVSFLYSCLVHIVLLGLWRMGILELPDTLVQLLFRRQPRSADVREAIQPTNAPAAPKEIPLTFIEVEPDQASPETPDNPKFYSAANAQAANPDPRKEAPVPQADGRQERMARLRDVPRAVMPVPQPPPPPPPPAASPPRLDTALRPSPLKAGELPIPAPLDPQPKIVEPRKPAEVADSRNTPKDSIQDPSSTTPAPQQQPNPTKARPRTLAQAREQAGLAGEQMKQEGGVRRMGRLAVDTKATPFGAYDAAMIKAVQDRWYFLIDNTTAALRSGRVVLEFTLHFNGSISDMRVRETEVGEVLALLCQRAVTDPAPYPRWPSDMHRMLGGNIRPVSITFLYY